jgi:hypothetical protein
MFKIKWFKLKKRQKEVLIDLGLYLVFFVMGMFYWLDLENKKESELFIHSSQIVTTIPTLVTPAFPSVTQKKFVTPAKAGAQTLNNEKHPFVASSRGKYVYPVDCSRAKSLSEKNKIFFGTLEEAVKDGYKEYEC